MIIERQSIVSGKTYQMELDVTQQQLNDFFNGRLGLIQEEFLICLLMNVSLSYLVSIQQNGESYLVN
jgi:hypothetical protein